MKFFQSKIVCPDCFQTVKVRRKRGHSSEIIGCSENHKHTQKHYTKVSPNENYIKLPSIRKRLAACKPTSTTYESRFVTQECPDCHQKVKLEQAFGYTTELIFCPKSVGQGTEHTVSDKHFAKMCRNF